MSDLVQIDGLPPLTNGQQKTSKIMLLFPPEWVPTAPYLALPSLTAVLRQAGHHVIQRDINIEMYDHFFTTEFLIWIKARQTMQLKALEAKELRGELTDKEMGQQAALEQAAGVDLVNVSDSAMARVRMGAMAVAFGIQHDLDLECLVHFTTRDRNLMALESELLGAHAQPMDHGGECVALLEPL